MTSPSTGRPWWSRRDFAQETGVKTLVLSHLVPAIDNITDDPPYPVKAG